MKRNLNRLLFLSVALLCLFLPLRAQSPVGTAGTAARQEMHAPSASPLDLYVQGLKCLLAQQYDEALTLFEGALTGYRALGKRNGEIESLQKIAAVKMHLYDFAASKERYAEALALAKQAGDTSKQMELLKEMWSMADKAEDRGLMRTCSAAMDTLMEGVTDVKTKFAYCQLKGDEANGNGQIRLAEEWYKRAVDLAEGNEPGAEALNKDVAYLKLRDLYAYNGRYEESLVYARKCLVAYQEIMPPDDEDYYLPYFKLADIYCKMGDKAGCLASLDTLFTNIAILTEPRKQSVRYTTRATCLAYFGDYAEALADFRRADEALATKYPPADGDRVKLLPLIGGLENRLGNYEASEECYALYTGYIRQIYGAQSMEHINARIYLANAEGFAGHLAAGCIDYTEATAALKAMMKEHFPYMSATEQEGFWKPVSSLFTLMTPYALEAGERQSSFTRSCYDALVLSKAFLLASERTLFDVVKEKGTPEDMHDYMQLAAMKQRIKAWEKAYDQYADSILALSGQADRLSRLLAERCQGYGELTDFMDIDYEAVKRALHPDEVLIDFTDFVTEAEGRKYAAYLIDKHDDYPLLQPLFAERQIDSLGITRPDMYYQSDYAPDVLRLLWEPLQASVPEGTTVYYVPSQLLFQVSLESLPLGEGDRLGDHYRFVRLSSARELVKAQSAALAEEPRSAVLYGGLQYDLQPAAMAAEAKKYDVPPLLAMRGVLRGDSLFRELPGTRQEITKIDSILQAHKWQVTVRMGMEGTEESFLALHGHAPQVLQLATHGFYYTPDRAQAVDFLKGCSDAMSLSGIVLSGGNAAWLGKELPEGVLGGILTADNIARIDLSGTELTVLSACQSGQGEATSEGLYGLQRAFKKAGTGTMVMSLWSVSDAVTTDFMVTFYAQLANDENRWNKRKAFEATKALIRLKYPDPFYWAAFVMVD